MSELVRLLWMMHSGSKLWVHCAFRQGDKRVNMTRSATPLNNVAHLISIKRHLWNQYDVSAAGDTTLKSYPACVPAHQLHNYYPVMALCGGVQPVQRLRRPAARTLNRAGDWCTSF